MTLFFLGASINCVWLAPRNPSWHFDILDIFVSLSKHFPLIDSSSWWDCEWFLVHFLEWLHLVALGDHCGCGVLVTLGGCGHLDGLEQWRSFGMCGWFFMASSDDCDGSCTFPGEALKGNSSGLLVSLSYHTFGLVLMVSNYVDEVRATPLSRVNHQVLVDTTETCVPASTWTSREKSCVHLCVDWISSGDWIGYIMIGSFLNTVV
jgi:hypothetical protein